MTTEAELKTMTDETLGSNTPTGTEVETVTVRTGEEELFAAVPAFDFSNITIMGYDLLKPHMGGSGSSFETF